MRKYALTSLVIFPLLLGYSHAAQTWSVDPSEHTMVFSSDDNGNNAYLGVDIADVTSERVSALKLKEEKGVEVTMVDQDAPAGKAGLKEHDVILTLNGTTVESAAQLRRMIHETPPGRVVTFGLSRDGQPVTLKVQLADKHKEFASMPKSKEFHIEMPEIPPMPELDIPSFNMVVVTSSPRSGLTVENITPQLGEFFGVKTGTGVLVRAVAKGSRADKAGFRAGDVIVKVNGQPVHDTSDFTHAVRSRNGSAVSVGVVREKKEQNISLPLPDRNDSGEMREETFDFPRIDAQAVDLEDVREEVAQLRPQLRLAAEDGQKYAEEARKSTCHFSQQARQEAERLRNETRREAEHARSETLREVEAQRNEVRQQLDEAKREALHESGELRREAQQERDELRKQQQELRDQMRRMQREVRRAWLDI